MAFDPAAVELRDVTTENFDHVVALQVGDHQRDFLNTNAESVAWAYVAPECRPLAIYAGTAPVGLATYRYVPAEGHLSIVHFMVDERFQRRGVGRGALERLLARMGAESGGAAIGLAVDPSNVGAIRLYEAFGFRDTGRRQNGELVMRREAVG